jgi:hypothetical protein
MKLIKSDLEALYEKFGSILKGARYLNIPRTTLNKMFKDNNIKVKRGHPKNHPHKHWNKLRKWLLTYDMVFPRNMKKISSLTNLTYNTVKSFFWRRKKILEDLIKQLPDLRTTSLRLITKKGWIFPFKYVLKYEISPDKFTYEIKLKLFMKPKGSRAILFRVKPQDLSPYVQLPKQMKNDEQHPDNPPDSKLQDPSQNFS